MLPRVLAQRAPCPDYPLVDGKWALRKHWVGREKTQCSCPAGLTINVTYPVPQDSPHPDVVLPAKKCHIAMRALAGLTVDEFSNDLQPWKPLTMFAPNKQTMGFTALEMERGAYGILDPHSALSHQLAGSRTADRGIVMVDIGANMGFASISFAMAYPSATVYAYELNPTTFASLSKNIEENGLQSRVKPFNMGLSADGRPISISRCQTTVGQGSQVMRSEEDWKDAMPDLVWDDKKLPKGRRSEGFYNSLKALAACRKSDDRLLSIPSITLSQILSSVGGRIDFLKVDCEGCEYSALGESTILSTVQDMVKRNVTGIAAGECHRSVGAGAEGFKLCKEVLLS